MTKEHGKFPADRYASKWSGLLRITRPGEYIFATASDDGSKLWLDDNLEIDNWGRHGRRRREATVQLQSGWHTIEAQHFENGGGANMSVWYKGADTDDKEVFCGDEVYHTHEQAVSVEASVK